MSKNMNLLSKLKFILKKPKLIVVVGSGRTSAKKAVFQVLSRHPQAPERSEGWRRRNLLRPGKDILLSESDLKNPRDIEELKFLIDRSSLFVLVATHTGDILSERDSFAGNKETIEEIRKLSKTILPQNWLILNFDDEAAREMSDMSNLKTITFGFQQGADFQASDINLNGRDARSASVAGEPVLGTNFKINYKGNIVPVWLEGICNKEQIYSALAAACVGTIFDLNLIEISQALKNCHF